jgi:hypothetical protein
VKLVALLKSQLTQTSQHGHSTITDNANRKNKALLQKNKAPLGCFLGSGLPPRLPT